MKLKDLTEVITSVAPLAILLLFLKVAILRSPLESLKQFSAGIVLTVVGLFLFLAGAKLSLIPLAESTGANLLHLSYRPVIIVVAFILGFAATLVEPALRVLADQADEISVGAISPKLLMGVVAFGFACGMAIGVLKILYGIKLVWVLAPILLVALVLSCIATPTFSGLAFDCASATTGPVNIPVNMAIALGLARSIEGVDPLTAGFGIVGLTCLGSAVAVLALGVLRG